MNNVRDESRFDQKIARLLVKLDFYTSPHHLIFLNFLIINIQQNLYSNGTLKKIKRSSKL